MPLTFSCDELPFTKIITECSISSKCDENYKRTNTPSEFEIARRKTDAVKDINMPAFHIYIFLGL